jgi:predicted signal transduction protein with EAL and GGDEF domain
VLCPNIRSAQNAEALALRIHHVLSESMDIAGQREHVSCSVGIALSNGSDEPNELMSNADVAMYHAKSTGRNRTVLYDSAMRQLVEARHGLSGALREAIDLGAIDVAYQPIVDIGTGEICAVEALARWDRPGHGPVDPADFIPVAEESGLIVELGKVVLRRVCEQQVSWARAHPDHELRITVNLSARELSQPDCVPTIESIVKASGASPSALTLELTETAFSANLSGVERNLHRLRALGFTIALDDFGTGYSSLTYLRRFPIDIVKIDRSFMAELAPESADSSILSLVLSLGRSLDITVIAEGVETDEQLRVLQELECGFAQGYLFSRPLEADATAQLVWPDFETIDIRDFDTST